MVDASPTPEPGAGRRVRLTVEFDGTEFFGWQRQVTGERTVQGALEEALANLPGRHGSVIAAGRTDAGVHALAMTAHADVGTGIPDEKLRLALNAHLPRDAAVVHLETCAADFHAQYDCRYRRYLYRMRIVRDRPIGLALDRYRVLPVFRHLDVAAMQEATHHLLGSHDFSTFATRETRSRERTVYLCELRDEQGELRLHVAGDGFLRGMVRGIVGTLLWIGKGKLAPGEVPALLAARDRNRAGHNVAPYGLYFAEAGYQPWDRDRSEGSVASRIP